jgi:hypothetical protein
VNESDIFDEFERLWTSFDTYCQSAELLHSPDPHDDQFIRMAVIGFSCHDDIKNWRQDHFKIAREYADESIQLGDSTRLTKFNLLALGALLGLYSTSKLDDRLYRIGYALLPGFVMGKGNAVDTL